MNAVDQFRGLDVADFPDIHGLPTELDAALWVLVVGKERLGLSEMTVTEIADVATHGFLRPLSRQRVAAELNDANGLVVKKPKVTPTRFVVMRPGIDRIMGQRAEVLLIDPLKAFTVAQKLEQLLSSVQGDVLLCDPYVDDKTLVALSSVPKGAPIKLLTLNVSDPAKFRNRLAAYQREYGNVTMRISSTPDLHDRYLIDSTRMWLIGTSLNGIGKKQSFIVAVGEDIKMISEKEFQRRWSVATSWT